MCPARRGVPPGKRLPQRQGLNRTAAIAHAASCGLVLGNWTMSSEEAVLSPHLENAMMACACVSKTHAADNQSVRLAQAHFVLGSCFCLCFFAMHIWSRRFECALKLLVRASVFSLCAGVIRRTSVDLGMDKARPRYQNGISSVSCPHSLNCNRVLAYCFCCREATLPMKRIR